MLKARTSSIKRSNSHYNVCKNYSILLSVIFIGIFFFSSVSAENCQSNLSNNNATCDIGTTNLTLINDIYYKNTSGYVIRMNNVNSVLDCNGSSIIGNYTGAGGVFDRPIQLNANNATIKNCNFINYRYSIRVDGFNNTNLINIISNNTNTPISASISDKLFIVNYTFNNITTGGIGLVGNIITNSFFKNLIYNKLDYEGIEIESSNNLEIQNVSFINYIGNKSLIDLNRTTGLLVENVSGACSNNKNSILFNVGDYLYRSANDLGTNITINKVNGEYCHWIIGVIAHTNITIKNSFLSNSDRGIRVYNISNGIIKDTICKNNTYPYDDHNTCIDIKSSENIYVTNGNFTEVSWAGAFVQKSNNITFNNISINMIPMTKRNNYLSSDLREFPCAYKITEIMKSFLDDNQEVAGQNNLTFVSTFKSSNIAITNNQFFNVQCYLHTQGGINISNDFGNIKNIKFQVPILSDFDEIILPNDFLNLSRYSVYPSAGSNMSNYENFNATINNYIRFVGLDYFNYSITNNYLKFLNKNDTTNFQVNIYNQSNTLIYFSNGSALQGSGNINITLQPNNYSYVLNSFNLTEGITRQFSPLWFSQSSLTEKHIASNLSETITSTILFNVEDCDNIAKIVYRSDSGNYTQTLIGSEVEAACSNNVVTMNNVQIEPASNSNTVTITKDLDRSELSGMCTNLIDGFGSFGELLALIVIAVVFVIVVAMVGEGNMSIKEFLGASVMTLVMGTILLILGSVAISFIC